MKYEIQWIEQKPTSTGKTKADARLKDETGALYEHVTIWGDFPGYSEIMNGGTIEGTLTPASDPKYAPSLKPLVGPKTASNSAFKQHQIEQTMEKKNASISHFQDNKELSIKIASTMNKAVELAMAEFDFLSRISLTTRPELDVLVLKWREWLWLHWDVKDTDFPAF